MRDDVEVDSARRLYIVNSRVSKTRHFTPETSCGPSLTRPRCCIPTAVADGHILSGSSVILLHVIDALVMMFIVIEGHISIFRVLLQIRLSIVYVFITCVN